MTALSVTCEHTEQSTKHGNGTSPPQGVGFTNPAKTKVLPLEEFVDLRWHSNHWVMPCTIGLSRTSNNTLNTLPSMGMARLAMHVLHSTFRG